MLICGPLHIYPRRRHHIRRGLCFGRARLGAAVPAGTGEQIAGSEARSAPDPAKYYNKYASCDKIVEKR